MPEPSLAPRRPVVLMILDGFGVNPCPINNGVLQAKTPRLDDYFSRNPLTLLQASGGFVGLPDGQMGNSEVGHLTIGCGQIIRQDLVAIDEAISNGIFFENAALRRAIENAKRDDGNVHLVGLVSNGGVHSHMRHLLALIDLCHRLGTKPILHAITDGRDTAPKSAMDFLLEIMPALEAAGGYIATICGRYYAMDRDNRWDRIQSAWLAMTRREGTQYPSVEAAIEAAYANDVSDEFILPCVLPDAGAMNANDSVIFFNFRKDRARQLTAALFKPDFSEFERGDYTPLEVTCMTEYDEWFRLPCAFQQDKPETTLSDVISRCGLKQFHCAETEKYAHVTYFLNGRHGEAFSGEERVIVPSPKVATYDLAPQMSAKAVADEVINAIQKHQYAFIAVNFANGDMVGHTGVMNAIIQSIEALDDQVGRVLDAADSHQYSVVLTADHGNCEQMVDYVSGEPHTQHSVFPVPCMVMDETMWSLSIGAGLSSIAPTILHLMGLKIPDAMTGRSLLLNPLS